MSFKFMHSKIDTRSAVPSLSEVVKLAQTKKALASGQGQIKTASAVLAPKVAKKKEAEEDCVADDEGGEEENAAFPGAAPKFKKKESKKASTKVAEKEEGESSGQPEAEAKLVNEPKKPEGAKSSGGGSKGGDSDEGESSGQLDVEPLHQEGESTGTKPGGLDTQKGGEGKKEAGTKTARFVRVAELTDTQKEFLRKTWSLYWPKSFIDALLAAK